MYVFTSWNVTNAFYCIEQFHLRLPYTCVTNNSEYTGIDRLIKNKFSLNMTICRLGNNLASGCTDRGVYPRPYQYVVFQQDTSRSPMDDSAD